MSSEIGMSGKTFDKWVLITLIAAVAVIVIPLIVIWIMLQLPSEFALIATILLIILWGVASGYKDWVMSKRREEENKKES